MQMKISQPTRILLAALVGAACSSGSEADVRAQEDSTTTGSQTPDAEPDGTAAHTGSSTLSEQHVEGMPCDVETLLVHNCQSCHDDEPRFGAPMPLVELADLLAPLPSEPSRTVAAAIPERIEDSVRPMPPTGLLDDGDREILAQWIEADMPGEDDPHCEVDDLDPGPEVGPEALPCEPSYTFRAHGAEPSEPFHVPDVDDVYTCFNFAVPFEAQTEAIAWAPLIDDERVLHHFIIYATAEPLELGAVGPCQIPEDAAYVGGWAPGRGNVELPPDVGLELPDPGGTVILEIHYNNVASHADALDRSGVALCTVDEPRPSTAGFVRVGTYDIEIPAGAQAHEEHGSCPPWLTREMDGPVEILSAFPHMHELGRSFRTEIVRGGDEGVAEMLVDVPHFSFENQVGYEIDPPILFSPGDALQTTCTFDNPGSSPVFYGPDTSDEMCFNRLLVHPIDRLPWRDCIQ
jgi:hypothetical protein